MNIILDTTYNCEEPITKKYFTSLIKKPTFSVYKDFNNNIPYNNNLYIISNNYNNYPLTQSFFSGATPFLYRVINDRYKYKYPWLAMVSVMSLQFFALPLLIVLAILRNKKFDEEEK